MKKILAVSGGIDSAVMLDIAAKEYSPDDIIVAHFDHGIRSNSHQDAEFVETLASHYGSEFFQMRVELGKDASEALARKQRYVFLENLAQEKGGLIWTAHHLDDLVETIMINLLRGTGWRGLAILDRKNIYRPFLDEKFFTEYFTQPPTKNDLYQYAAKHNLHFREDPSNNSDQYLRNRLRNQLTNMSNEKKYTIYNMWCQQKELKNKIDHVISEILPTKKWQRSWFKELDTNIAIEILRAGLLRNNISATRPQIASFLKAILTYEPGRLFNLPGGRLVRINKNNFEL